MSEMNLKVGDEVFIYASSYGVANWITGKIERETRTQWIVKSDTTERRFYKDKHRYFSDANDFLQEVGAKTNPWAVSYSLRPINEKTLKEYDRAQDKDQRKSLTRDLQEIREIPESVSTERLEQIVKELKGE